MPVPGQGWDAPLCTAVTGNPSAEGEAQTEAVGDGSAQEGSPRTPDQSTVGMSSAAEPEPGLSGDDDVPRLKVGELLAGRFSVVRFIARGGMGAVYEATDVLLRSRVALKVIRSLIATDAVAMERFRREVLLARRVGHPNVCHVYELYEATPAAGVPIHFLTMELLEGESLAQHLARKGRLTTAEALPLVRQMCEGLAAAHAEGVVHRDFKSSNVMLVTWAPSEGQAQVQSTRVVITDFGVARAAHLSAGTEPDEGRLTGRAAMVGTPAYMAPEQVTGGTVSPATDIYSLGVVLYEMVTGKLPFAADTPLACAARRLNEAPPRPELLASGLDARWADAIVRCLAREPKRRFRTALDVLEALTEPPRRWRRPLFVAGLVSVLLLGAFAAVWALSRPQRGKASRVASVTAPRPVAAILGFANALPSKGLSWLPTAVEEGLHHELAAAETSLRVLPTDRVANARRSLGITEDGVSELQSRSRLQGLLVANTLIYGDIAPAGPGSDAVHVRLHLLDGPTGRELALFSEELGPGAAKLPAVLVRLGSNLRHALHASPSPEEEAALTPSRIRSLDAAHAYAEGVLSMRAFDYTQARDFFDAALAHDSDLVDAQRRIVESWERQGFRRRASEAAERLALQRHLLTSGQSAELAAQALALGPDAQKGRDAQLALFNTRSDDVELGLEVAFDDMLGFSSKTELAIVRRLRQLPSPPSGDLRLDLLEAEADPDSAHTDALLAAAERRAKELGARSELAWASELRADTLWNSGRGLQAVTSFQEALRLFSEVRALEDVARTRRRLAILLADSAPPREAIAALDEAAGVHRRLGNRWRLHNLLSFSAFEWFVVGEGEVGKKRLEEALTEAQLVGEPPSPNYLWAKAFGLYLEADVAGLKGMVQALRAGPSPFEALALLVEGWVLREQDHLEEARGSLLRTVLLREQSGDARASVRPLSDACRVECEKGHPAQGLACLATVPKRSDMGGRYAVLHDVNEAQCRYLSLDFAGAEKAARQALADAPPGDLVSRAISNIELARAMAARGENGKAISALNGNLAEVESRHYTQLAFEAALALGEAELAAGFAGGRARLVRLEQEARTKEFFRIARLAREALDRNRSGKSG